MTSPRVRFGLTGMMIAASLGTATQSTVQPGRDPAEVILDKFVQDFRDDRSLHQPVTFSVQVGERHWHVVADPGAAGQRNDVEMRQGDPATPTFFFGLDLSTLQRLDRGEVNALTAAVQALPTDPAPLRIGLMKGASRSPETLEQMQKLAFHFWTRGIPEVIPFGDAFTRLTHGTDAVILYYQRGFRSGWFSLKPGQHANKDPRSQVNPFPTLLVITSGAAKGRIGGRELDGRAGQAFLIPAGTAHEFWNPSDKPVEGLLLMFGPGA